MRETSDLIATGGAGSLYLKPFREGGWVLARMEGTVAVTDYTFRLITIMSTLVDKSRKEKMNLKGWRRILHPLKFIQSLLLNKVLLYCRYSLL